MTHHDAFLQSILAAPGDDTPRLIYADWLEEHGDAERAELIRVQCRVASCKVCDGSGKNVMSPCSCSLLRHREQDLLSRFECWHDLAPLLGTGALAEAHRPEVWRRGFIASVALSCTDWIAHGPAIVRAAPIQDVRLTDYQPMFISIDTENPGWVFRIHPLDFYLPKAFDAMMGRSHASEAEALAVQSTCCIRWAREQLPTARPASPATAGA